MPEAAGAPPQRSPWKGPASCRRPERWLPSSARVPGQRQISEPADQ